MFKQENKNIFWIIFPGLITIFLVSKYVGPEIIEILYASGNTDILNKLTGSKIIQPLNFYLGSVEELFLGPISMVASGLAFLSFCFFYLKKVNIKIFALAVFLYFLVTKIEVLFFPPYGDSIVTAFAEAIWLARHSFDYIGLANQPTYFLGGPKIYLFSIYPTYQAILIKLIPNVKFFLLINHLITFALGASIAALFRNILLKLFNEKIALLISILFLSLPLVQSMVEAINMAIPVLFFSMISINYLVKKNIRMASIMVIIASLVKGYAVTICLSISIVSIFLFLWGEKEYRFKWKTLFWGLLSILVLAMKAFVPFLLFKESVEMERIRLFYGWRNHLMWYRPLYFYLGTLLACVVFFIKEKINNPHKFAISMRHFVQQYYIPLIFFVGAGTWLFVFLHTYAFTGRYTLLLTPFTLFCGFFAFQLFIKSEKFLQWSLISLIIFSFLCSYGLLYPSEITDTYFVAFERSLEYRKDIKVNLRLARKIENRFHNFTIGAPFCLAQLLALPELGYVRKNLDVMIYGMQCTYGNIKNFEGLSKVDREKTIWVGDNTVSWSKPLKPYDRVVEEICEGTRKIVLFSGGMAIEDGRLKVLSAKKPELFKEFFRKDLKIREIGKEKLANSYVGEVKRIRQPSTLTTITKRMYKRGNPTDVLVAYIREIKGENRVGKEYISLPIQGKILPSDINGSLVIFYFPDVVRLSPGIYEMGVRRIGKADDHHYYCIYAN